MKPLLIALGLGVAGVAAYLFSRPSEAARPSLVPQDPGAPDKPLPAPVGPDKLVYASDEKTMHLRSKSSYRGRLELRPSGLPPFSLPSDEVSLAKALSALGFDRVELYSAPSLLPTDWPMQTAQNPTAATRWFAGRWTGLTMPAMPKPVELESLWITASEELTASRMAAGK